jgi:hypothetical protein
MEGKVRGKGQEDVTIHMPEGLHPVAQAYHVHDDAGMKC